MKASKIIYKDEYRIKLEFPYDTQKIHLLKQIEELHWSKTLKCWLIPYTNEAFKKLVELFPDVDYPKDKPLEKSDESGPLSEMDKIAMQAPSIFSANVNVLVTGRRIEVRLPKKEADTRFLVSLRYSRWDKKKFCWVIPNYPGNLDLLKDHFASRIQSLELREQSPVDTGSGDDRKVGDKEVMVIRTKSGRLKIYVGFNKEITKLIKTIPFYSWNTKGKWWSIPFLEKYLQEIKSLATSLNFKFHYEEEEQGIDSATKRKAIPEGAVYLSCPEEYLLKLRELRYSENTLKTYRNAFEEFINYYHGVELSAIDESMIVAFLQYLVTERKVSISYQNQAINAIKFYYERVVGGARKVYTIERPRQEKALPEVLNEKEVLDLFQATDNIKHKAIMMLAYGSGLRLSELLHIKIKDIDSGRMQIRIEQSKGKKDRYSILSIRLLDVLRNYVKEYKPREFLFEGVGGGQYSGRSIQAIVKAAVKKAGIKKKISVHNLRHTFATHLMEHGTDLRYIQNLLGHESSKTTEIYTHITTRGFDQIKSPLDHLDL